MNIEIYICEGELTDNSSLYIPDFKHQEHMFYPLDSNRTTLVQLKEQGSEVLKQIDITKEPVLQDSHPVVRHLLVVRL